MIRNREQFQSFEKELIEKEKIDFKKNLRIVEAMYDEAVALGIIPMKNPLDKIDIDIKIARILNGVSKYPHEDSSRVR